MRIVRGKMLSRLRNDRVRYLLIVSVSAAAVLAGAIVNLGSSVAKSVPVVTATSARVPSARSSHTSIAAIKPMGVPGQWNMILNSQFNQPLDTSVWRPGWFGTGVSGPINSNENACYSPRNVSFPGDGTLHLDVTATRSRCEGKTRQYTGAILTTNPHDGRATGGFVFRYGVMQAKVYVPGAPGGRIANWPTVMTLGQVWPKDGEDDILEGLSGTDCLHFHSPGNAPGGNLGGCDPGFTPGWHTIAANWEPGSVSWYYDGVEIDHIAQGVTTAPMYLVLVNTVSIKGRAVAGADSMRVAYVRVWQKAGTSTQKSS